MKQSVFVISRNRVFTALWTVLLCLTSLFIHAQELHSNNLPILEEYPFFNRGFIKSHSVQKIETEVLYKWPNQPIRKSFETKDFEFDQRGVTLKYRSCDKKGVCTSSTYFLNKDGFVATSQYLHGSKNELHAYYYDADGLLLKIEKNNTADASFIAREEFSYERYSEKQYKKFYLNDEGLTYKYEVVDLDGKQRVIDRRSRFIHGSQRSTLHVVYEDDLLVEYVSNVRDFTRREEKYAMQYDANDRLQVTELWVDAALVYRYEYLYENGLLEAILRKNLKTQEIQITKLRYTFFKS